MKYIFFKGISIILITLILNACSSEFYELKKSPCACNELNLAKA